MSDDNPSRSIDNPTEISTGYGPRATGDLQSKDLGKKVGNLIISEEVVLKNRFNYQLWNEAISKSFRYVEVGLHDYMNSNNQNQDIYEEAAEMLLIRYVDKSIFGQYKRKGLIGREIYKEIVKKYGKMSVHDKVRHAINLNQQSQLKSPSVTKSIEYGKQFDNFMDSLNENEREAMNHLVRINEKHSGFVEKFLNMDDPTLKLDNIEEFLERFPIYKDETQKPIIALASQKGVRGNADVWAKQCTRCFGLGHIQSECGSPMRIGFVPDLENKLLQFKNKKRKTNTNTNTNFNKNANNSNKNSNNNDKFVSDAPNPWNDKTNSNNSANMIICSGSLNKNEDIKDKNFYYDTGASVSVTYEVSKLHNYTELETPCEILVANNQSVKVYGYGKLLGETKNGNKIEIPNVGFCPSLIKNLISPKDILNSASNIQITKESVIHSCLGNIGDYQELAKSNIKFIDASNLPNILNINLHNALGHPSLKLIKKIGDKIGIEIKEEEIHDCEICPQAKTFKRFPKESKATKIEQPLFVVSFDIAGPFDESVNGYKYFLVAVDHFTRFKTIKCLKSRTSNEVGVAIEEIIKEFETNFKSRGDYKVVNMRSDNAKEFLSNEIQSIFSQKGITHQTTVAYNSHQNGMAERAIRVIKMRSTAVLTQLGLPYQFWEYAVKYATFVNNLLPIENEGNQIPYEIWCNKVYDYEMLHPFGSLVFAHVPENYRKDFEPIGRKTILLGYATNKHAYEVFDIEKKTLCYAISIKGYDHKFPAKELNNEDLLEIKSKEQGITSLSSSYFQRNLQNNINTQELRNENLEDIEEDIVMNTDEMSTINDQQEESNSTTNSSQQDLNLETSTESIEISSNNQQKDSDYIPSDTEETQLTGDESLVYDPNDLNWSMINERSHEEEIRDIQTNRRVNVVCQIIKGNEITDDKQSDKEFLITNEPIYEEKELNLVYVKNGNIIAQLTQGNDIPKNYEEAMKSPDQFRWQEAMNLEMQSLYENDTFELVDLPKDRKVLGTRWVYTKKDGNTRFKARVVCKGYDQVYGQDYYYTYSPVIRAESVRLILALAALSNKILRQFDVVTAFLNSDIKEEIYVEIPKGFKERAEGKVYRLNKCLYGLRQSPLQWYHTINKELEANGFKKSEVEYGLYYKKGILLGLYVDDVLVAGDSNELIAETRNILFNRFKMKDLGSPKMFLGFNILQKQNSIRISLSTYIDNLLTEYGMEKCKLVKIPCDITSMKQLASSPTKDMKKCNPTEYRELVGKLLFISNCVRFDIAYITGMLARHFQDPYEIHYLCAKHVLRYLSGTKESGLIYKRGSGIQVFADADWGNSLIDKRSLSGTMIILAGAPIAWRSKKQTVTALSTTEAEYYSLLLVTKMVTWLLEMLKDTEYEIQIPIIIYLDSQTAISLASHPMNFEKTKHILVQYYFLREKVSQGIIKIKYLRTTEMIADMLTKPLSWKQFNYLATKAGLRNKCITLEELEE